MEKKLVSYNIAITVIDKFNKVAKENSINKSSLIENLLLNYIKTHEKK